jgi:hypothetical protein
MINVTMGQQNEAHVGRIQSVGSDFPFKALPAFGEARVDQKVATTSQEDGVAVVVAGKIQAVGVWVKIDVFS